MTVRRLRPLNGGRPFEAVLVPSDWEGEPDSVGLVRHGTQEVWIGEEYASARAATGERVALPKLPQSCELQKKCIGGVSATLRCNGALRYTETSTGTKVEHENVTLFALGDMHLDVDAALASEPCAVRGRHEDDEGRVFEVVVFRSVDVDRVAALAARAGAEVVLEHNGLQMRSCIAIERLDRIACQGVFDADTMCPTDANWGVRRGFLNWKFNWLPPSWTTAPLTWDQLVKNIPEDVPLTDLPELVAQHVARHRGVCQDVRRSVSCALTEAQSEQLITAFYLVVVERVSDPVVFEAARLIMFRYLLLGGYMARWLGRYAQTALHVGNGDRLRKFVCLEQYQTHRLPSAALNRIVLPDGGLECRGSKGSRSKYRKRAGARPYVPSRRLHRVPDDEAVMFRSTGDQPKAGTN